ncbi:MAG: MlaA family lipoprotein [Candidatus Binatia bacterium]
MGAAVHTDDARTPHPPRDAGRLRPAGAAARLVRVRRPRRRRPATRDLSAAGLSRRHRAGEPRQLGVERRLHRLGVANPLGRAYRFVTPRYLRDRLRDFASNLDFPRNFVANLLMGERGGAGHELARFATNTTAGVSASGTRRRTGSTSRRPRRTRPGLRPLGLARLDLRGTLVLGPSTVRDTVGLGPDMLLDPASLLSPLAPALKFNDLVDSIDEYRLFATSSADAYFDAHTLAALAREVRIEPPTWSDAGDDTGAVQTLGAVLLAPKDPHFGLDLDTGRVRMPVTERELPYSYRLQPGRAPLVFIVPGLGAHRLGAGTLALAEMLWERGCSLAIVSSTMNAEFIAAGGSVPVPGHAPVDARDTHVALDAIARDLGRRYPDRIGRHVYLGYSLGAFHGFFIAAEERQGSELVGFDRYVLLDPPVRLLAGMEQLDAFANLPLALPAAERDAEARRILLKAVAVGKRALADRTGAEIYARFDLTDADTAPRAALLPFTNAEAEYLIGVAFQRSLKAVLWASQQRDDLGVLLTERRDWRRLPAYEEMGDYSFEQYFYAFLLPYYRRAHGAASAQEMIAANDLHALADGLRDNGKLRVFANRNDFLTSDADLAWLADTVGSDRVRIFPSGGHLGNLHQPAIQAEVSSAVADPDSARE